jgi:hypothetical protein
LKKSSPGWSSPSQRKTGSREKRDNDDEPDLQQWDETHSELWSHQPIRLEHEMHNSPAFSMDDLAGLIEGYPRQHYSIVQTGARGSSRVWREGDIGNLKGGEVIDAISRGELWLNLREVGSVDSRYANWSIACSRKSPPRYPASRCRKAIRKAS